MTKQALLLDTHAAIWLTQGAKLLPAATVASDEAGSSEVGVFVSVISAWEVGLLVAKERLALSLSPVDWFQALLDAGVQAVELTPSILIASSFLRGQLHGDPADRIIASTARTHGLRRMTRDDKLLRYADAGHIQAIAC